MSTNNEPRTVAIIFSFVDGAVLASWPSQKWAVKLGPYDAVTYMMRDFLAQCELGDRMARKHAHG